MQKMRLKVCKNMQKYAINMQIICRYMQILICTYMQEYAKWKYANICWYMHCIHYMYQYADICNQTNMQKYAIKNMQKYAQNMQLICSAP